MNLILDFLGRYLPVIIIGGGIIFVIAPKFFFIVTFWICGWLILFLFFFIIDKSLNFNYFKDKKINTYFVLFGLSSAFFLLFLVMFGPAALLIFLFYAVAIAGVGLVSNYVFEPLAKEIDRLGFSKNYTYILNLSLALILIILFILMIPLTVGTIHIFINGLLELIDIDFFNLDR